MEPQPTYWSRWRTHPLSCAGHVAQGVLCGVLVLTGQPPLMALAALWLLLYATYQGLSMARKAVNRHRADTGGLDTADAITGIGLALAGRAVWWGLTTTGLV